MPTDCSKRRRSTRIVAPASLRAGEAASCRPCTEKLKQTREVDPTGCKRSWKFILSLPKGFVTGPQGCLRY